MIVRPGDLDDPQVIRLLAVHAGGMLANSPVDACHFLDVSALRSPDIDFLTCWEDETLLGMGALKALGDGTGEIKSMRTVEHAQRQGVAAAILAHIVAIARARGYSALLLETGTGPSFEAAHALYKRHGFVPCPAFADYTASDFNRFLRLDLAPTLAA